MNVDEMIDCLKGLSDNESVAYVCTRLIDNPINDARFIPILQQLMMDYRVAMWTPIPYTYGEVRFLAAKALAHTYKVMGIKDIVHLDNTFYPMYIKQLIEFKNKAGFDERLNSEESQLEMLAKLRDIRALDMIDKDFDPVLVLAQSWKR
jgi:hypothetical protein